MRNSTALLAFILLISCSEPNARRPVNPKPSTTVLNTGIEESKLLNDLENRKIAQLIAQDSTRVYQVSPSGFWYTYINKITEETATPKEGNEAVFEYNIQDLNGNILYSKEELGVKTYSVDREDFIPALQQGIKLMKIGETITFVVPSYRAFGISGDGDRIGINQSIKSTVTLINIK